MKDLNSHLKGGKIHLKSLPGVKASQLNHYIKPTLEEYKYTTQKMKFSINDLFSKCDQIRSF